MPEFHGRLLFTAWLDVLRILRVKLNSRNCSCVTPCTHTPTPSCRALNSFRAIVRIYSIRPTDRSDGKVTCKVGGTGNNNRTSRPGNYAPAPPCSRCLNAQLPVVHEQTAQIANLPKSYELRAPLGRSDEDNVGFGVTTKAATLGFYRGKPGLSISTSNFSPGDHVPPRISHETRKGTPCRF